MKIERSFVWSFLADRDKQVTSELSWDMADPLAIHALFHDHNAERRVERTWVFARAILAEALFTGGAGEMDVTAVRVCNHKPEMPTQSRYGNALLLYLNSPDGLCGLLTEAAPLASFLNQTFAHVPFGFEADHYLSGFEEEIESLFGE